jgi:hypothetical protein
MSMYTFDGIQGKNYPFRLAPPDITNQLPTEAGLFILSSGADQDPKPEFLGRAVNIRQSMLDLETAGIWDTAWDEPNYAVTTIYTRLVPDAKVREMEFSDLVAAYRPSINMILGELRKQSDVETKHRSAQSEQLKSPSRLERAP